MSQPARVALVTGSARGIGRAIAVRLAETGADIAINYRRSADEAYTLAEQIQALGRRVAVLQADVTQPDTAARLVSAAQERLGTVDVLVNNVGDFFFKPVARMTGHEWQTVLDSNLSSVYHLCSAALPEMRRRGWGRIVNIGLSPTYLVRGAPNIAAYAIAKTGVLILTRSLAVEEARHGIAVNCVSPGLIDTGYLPPEQKGWMEKRVPMGRLGRPSEVADAVAYLTSEGAAYISGANLAVAGAWDWEDRPTHHDGDVHELFVGPERAPAAATS